MIYLCFDLGLSHIGVAISHEGTLAQTLPSFDSNDQSKLLTRVLALIDQYHPDAVLLGIPPAGPIVTLANTLKSELEDKLSLPIILHQEHKSSSQAQVLLKQGGASLNKRRRLDHSAAAAYILQDYLDNFA